jgi:hypothetical protein
MEGCLVLLTMQGRGVVLVLVLMLFGFVAAGWGVLQPLLQLASCL